MELTGVWQRIGCRLFECRHIGNTVAAPLSGVNTQIRGIRIAECYFDVQLRYFGRWACGGLGSIFSDIWAFYYIYFPVQGWVHHSWCRSFPSLSLSLQERWWKSSQKGTINPSNGSGKLAKCLRLLPRLNKWVSGKCVGKQQDAALSCWRLLALLSCSSSLNYPTGNYNVRTSGRTVINLPRDRWVESSLGLYLWATWKDPGWRVDTSLGRDEPR